MKKVFFCFIFLAFLIFPVSQALARVGVGVATGKIVINEKLKPGIIYNLPPLTVLNTGDVPSDYKVAVTYFQTQRQLKPANDWFIFSPSQFHLNPGQAQVVNIKLNLPIAVKPGDYFGFLEAHPIQKSKDGLTTIGIAAAAKLYFTIVPANIFYGAYYKLLSFWQIYNPWPQDALIALIAIAIIFVFKRFFNIQIGLKKEPIKQKEKADKDKNE
jgi:hypothetical protein